MMRASPASPSGIPLTPDRALAEQLARWSAASGDDPAACVAAAVAAVATHCGQQVELIVDGTVVDAAPAVAEVEVDPEVIERWGPWLPGLLRETLVPSEGRRGFGVHHTPPDVVEEILDLAETCGTVWTESTTALDPAVGGGAFLLAVASRLPGSRSDVVARLQGIDIDPLAVAATVAGLTLWAGTPPPAGAFRVADFLAVEPSALSPVDVVVGNPPFLSQLKGSGIRTREDRERLAARWAGVGRYVDDAMAFALASVDVVVEGGVVVLVQPASALGAADAEPVRARLMASAPLRGLWVDRTRRFAADVDTVALVACRGGDEGPVSVEGVAMPPPASTSWAPLLSVGAGTPLIERHPGPVLSDVARVTSGFRDQFYGLRGAVDDDPDGAHPLVTSGAIDPLRLRWGYRPSRFDRVRYTHPVVDLQRVDEGVRPWVEARMVPKVLVASQTKVIEAVVDEAGRAVPGTPVVSVEPTDPEVDVWHLAALLTSPVATALLVREAAGTALSADAVRVSARLLGSLPLPMDNAAWASAAEQARQGDVVGCGTSMLSAHGLGDRPDLLEWWVARIPARSSGM